jgi:signal peptidase II
MRDMQAARGTPLTGLAAAGQHDGADGRAGQSGEPAGVRPGGAPEQLTEPAGQPSPPPGPTGLEVGKPHRRIGMLVTIAVLVLALDLASKVIVVATLSDRAPIRLLGGFLTLRVDRNPGAAFSLGTSLTLVFSAIAITVIVVILRTSRRIRSMPWAITLGLLLGGATGNLADRIFRYPGVFRGYVVDWIQVPHWPVFNLADSAIVCGGILAVLLSVRGIRLDGQREQR